MTAAELIRAIRVGAKLSQADLARRSGLPRTVINAYERGTRDPSSTALALLAEACGQRLTAEPIAALDLQRNAQVLLDVLDLAEQLPSRPRARNLDYPPISA